MELPDTQQAEWPHMKLHYNPASPYVRKVRVVAIETFGARASMSETLPE